jgi:hypothetical protein
VFHDIKEDFAIKQINTINIKKAMGRDGISAKILKIAKLNIVTLTRALLFLEQGTT